MKIFSFAVATSVLLIAACGSGDDSTAPGGDASTTDAGNSTTDGGVTDGGASSDAASDTGVDAGPIPFTSLMARNVTLPGQSEGYMCTRIAVAADMDIVGFRNESTDLIVAGMVTAAEADAGASTGDYACSPGSLDTRLLYGFGVGTGDLVMPPDVSMHVTAGQFINLNLHVVNTGADSPNGTSTISIQKAPAGSTFAHAAQAFLTGTYQITIPSDNVVHTASSLCTVDQAWQIFALTPLMRQTGKHSNLVAVLGGTPKTVLDQTYDYAHEITYPLTPIFGMSVADKLELTCSYQNNTGTTQSYGDEEGTETCETVTYAYADGAPYERFDTCMHP